MSNFEREIEEEEEYCVCKSCGDEINEDDGDYCWTCEQDEKEYLQWDQERARR